MRAARSGAVPYGRAPLANARLLVLFLLAVAAPAAGAAGADSPSSTAQQEISSASFSASIERLDSGVRHLGEDAASAQRLGESVPAKWMVGERRVEVDAGALRELLDQYATRPQRRKELHAELSARVAELEDLAAELRGSDGGAQTVDAARAREHLMQILSRREFTSAMGSSWKEILMEKLIRWLAKHLKTWFNFLPLSGTGGRILLWVLVIALVCGAAVWLVRASSGRGIEALEAVSGAPPGVTWRDWARAGLSASKEGRFREAVHALYWAAVYRLEEMNVWSLDRARTPREYLRLLAAPSTDPAEGGLAAAVTPQQREALERLTRAFELTWYGYRQAGEEDFRSAAAQLEVFGCRLQ